MLWAGAVGGAAELTAFGAHLSTILVPFHGLASPASVKVHGATDPLPILLLETQEPDQ